MSSTPWTGNLPDAVQQHFGSQILEASTYLAQDFFVVAPEAAVSVLAFLHQFHGFDYLVDVTAVDHPTRPERFDLIYILYSYASNVRLRIHTRITEGFEPATATAVFTGANWLEREVFDMFGIRFAGHPNLKRILMPEEWEGYPLRKDYSILKQDDTWVQQNLHIESGQ